MNSIWQTLKEMDYFDLAFVVTTWMILLFGIIVIGICLTIIFWSIN